MENDHASFYAKTVAFDNWNNSYWNHIIITISGPISTPWKQSKPRLAKFLFVLVVKEKKQRLFKHKGSWYTLVYSTTYQQQRRLWRQHLSESKSSTVVNITQWKYSNEIRCIHVSKKSTNKQREKYVGNSIFFLTTCGHVHWTPIAWRLLSA